MMAPSGPTSTSMGASFRIPNRPRILWPFAVHFYYLHDLYLFYRRIPAPPAGRLGFNAGRGPARPGSRPHLLESSDGLAVLSTGSE